MDQVARVCIDPICLVQFVLLDKVDGSLREITALDAERRLSKGLNEGPESIADAAPKIEQGDHLL